MIIDSHTPTVPYGIVIPVRNEPASQVIALAREIYRYVAGPASIIVVDDSPPDHWQQFQANMAHALPGRAVRVIHRDDRDLWGRLAGAVFDAFRLLKSNGYKSALVLDGDAQHDPVALPEMVDILYRDKADVVVGSRYSLGGSPGDGLSLARRFVSKGCHLAARILFPARTKGCHDTMSGYFGVRLESIDLDNTWVNRFKVLLQVLAQHPGLRIAEVGYTFRRRKEGRSNAGLDEGIAYLGTLAKLVWLAYLRPTPKDRYRTVRHAS